MLRTFACVCGLGLAVTSAESRADELWRQSPINTVGGYSSQDARNPGGLGWFSAVADNFTASTAWSISQVEFWGGYVTVDAGHTQGFVVRFYADSNGSVGQLLHTDDNLPFTETVYYTDAANGWHGYHYVVNLPQPYTLPAAGTYWVSIVAILDRGGASNEPQWGWAQAPFVMNPPVAEQWFFDPGHFTPNPNNVDMAFVLNGSATGGGGPGVCCRGSTCTITLASPTACEGSLNAGQLAGAEFATGVSVCNAGSNGRVPCCYSDYNKANGITVQDIFDFLNDWFAGSPFTRYGSDGSPALLAVQNIFDFLNAWFAGGCG